MDFITECSARAIGFKEFNDGPCENKPPLKAPRPDTMFQMEAYWNNTIYIRHTQKTKNGKDYYTVNKEKCRCSKIEAAKPPVHIYSTFGHCVDYPNGCIAECAGHKIFHEGECIKLNKNITEICPCSDNITKKVYHVGKEGKCVEFQNSCFAECAGVTRFQKGKC
jgi:hypothetical protein